MKIRTRRAAMLAALLSATLAVPATASDEILPPTFSAEEIAWSKGYGPNNLDGIAALAGATDTATCAGEQVYLRPSSGLERHRNLITFGSMNGGRISAQRFMNPPGASETTMPAPPKEYDASARKATCSIDGKFLFTGIPDGEYYAITMLFPRALVGKIVPMENIEVIMKRVQVSGGKTVKVDLFTGT